MTSNRFLGTMSIAFLCIFIGQIDGESAPVSGRTDHEYIQKYRRWVVQDAGRLRTLAHGNAGVLEEAEVESELASPSVPSSVVEPKVIKLIRASYTRSSMTGLPIAYAGVEIAPIHTASGATSDMIADDLYVLRGDTAGLYEYTRLAGVQADVADNLPDGGSTWSDPELGTYYAYASRQEAYCNSAYLYFTGDLSILPPQSWLFSFQLPQTYWNDADVQRTLGYFPFEQENYQPALAPYAPGAAKKTRRSQAEDYDAQQRQGWRFESIKQIGDALAKYYLQTGLTSSARVGFLERVSECYGPDISREVISAAVDDQSFVHVNDGRFLQVFQLALTNKLYGVCGRMIKGRAVTPELRKSLEQLISAQLTDVSGNRAKASALSTQLSSVSSVDNARKQ